MILIRTIWMQRKIQWEVRKKIATPYAIRPTTKKKANRGTIKIQTP